MLPDRVVLSFAPIGSEPTKKDNPYVPEHPDEIVRDVRIAHDYGITMVHLHARDRYGKPTHCAASYASIIGKIREFAPGMIISASLSGRHGEDIYTRTTPLRLPDEVLPDMVSLTLGSTNFKRCVNANANEDIDNIARMALDHGVKPELVAFDLGMVHYAKTLIERGLITSPYYFTLMLGNISSAQVDLLHIAAMVRDLPSDSLWSLGGIGRNQRLANLAGITFGGGARVGLEDNLWFDNNKLRYATNQALVRRVHSMVMLTESLVMGPSEFRDYMALGRS